MNIKSLIPKTHRNWSWLWAVYLVFAVYLLVDLAVFQYSPYSGRISTLVCRPNAQQQMECTATLHGWEESVRHTFLASDFKRLVEIHSFPNATSESSLCGLKLQSTSGTVDFIHDRQPCRRIQSLNKKIFNHFNEHPSDAYRIIYLGWNLSVYTRLILLITGGWFICRKNEWFEDRLPKGDQITGFKPFLISWLKVNFSVKIILYLIVFILGGGWIIYNFQAENGTFLKVCHDRINLGQVCENCTRPPLVYLIGLYPLMAFASIQAIVQWKFLKQSIALSRWWISAPAVASIALVFGIGSKITCSEVKALQGLVAGWRFEIKSPLFLYIIMYALIIGIIQWLVLRKALKRSGGWVLMPLIATTLVSLGFYYFDQWVPMGEFYFDGFVFPILLLAAETFQASYLSWMVIKTKDIKI